MFDEPKLLPVGPMARRLHLPAKWLREEAETGRVPCLKADKAILFDPVTVEQALVRRARGEEVSPQ